MTDSPFYNRKVLMTFEQYEAEIIKWKAILERYYE